MGPDYFREIATKNLIPVVSGWDELERRFEIAAVSGHFSVTVQMLDEFHEKQIISKARALGFSVTEKLHSQKQFIFSY